MVTRWALAIVAGVAAMLLGAAPAHAQGLSATVYVGGNIPLSIPVTASVGGRCRFATGSVPDGSYDAGAIDEQAWSHDFEFKIDCNTASRVAVVSTQGGLKNATTGLPTGYTALAPYNVTLNLQGDTQTVTSSCAVAGLKASASSACSFRGPASSTLGLRLPVASNSVAGSYLRVSAPAYAGSDVLVLGNYADTLTVTIAAAP